jgi:protein SCO1/2
MTMPYRVRNESYLQTLAEGDEINGQIVVGREGTYLDNINVTKKGSGKSNRPVSKFHAPEEGEQVPDFELLNQDGKKVNLNQYRGKSILLTFIYTRCPMPDYCPRVTQNFAVIEKALVKEPAIHAKTHLLSVSFDPKFDTPKVLNEYGRNYIVGGTKAGFDHWEFVVAPEKILPDLAKFFGLLFKEDAGIIDHSMSTAIVSPDGKIYKWYTDNKWTSDEVLKDLRASVNATTVGTGAGH